MTAVPVLFDVDGVILRFHPDSPDVYADGVDRAFRACGVSVTDDELSSFVGDVSHDDMRAICDRYDLELATFWPERETQVSNLQRELIQREERMLYDDVCVLSTLAADRPLGFVSNNQQATIEYLLEHFEFEEYIETAYGRKPTWEGFERVKPSPYYIEVALDDLDAETAVYVGDRPSDVEAAHRANLTSVLLRRNGADTTVDGTRPDHEITTLEALPEVIDRIDS